ncbi:MULTISPECIES: VOC family protein [unclassified Spirosoma]|uniref:VOC family protein n=1 Tax=unclassified Spirosoma TaxID=2621999 RepID=UPI00095C05BF|nr:MULTISPECIES: VOC family protein [unclassified Spirosoma]MBN8820597.1 VOC family protein [Spirosoma sp.]OJW76076.1 MAG: VOC family protein [Spirosoma sp. 48-14]
MTQINPYLNFNGNCREAMMFYRECLGGELNLQTIGESPISDQMSDEIKDRILHAGLTKDGHLLLMGSDMMGSSLIAGNSVTLSINCRSEEDIRRFFSTLAEGGQIKDPLSDMFWGALFGSLTDKFGLSWVLNYSR